VPFNANEPRERLLRLLIAPHTVAVDPQRERGVLVAELVHNRAGIAAERYQK